MLKKEDLIFVGNYNIKLNKLLGLNITEMEIYRSKGLPAHMIKKKHFNCLKYIDKIPDILQNPDYVGINPNENGISIELIKRCNIYILIGIKLDINENYMYISTVHDLQDSKIKRKLFSARLKDFKIDKDCAAWYICNRNSVL